MNLPTSKLTIAPPPVSGRTRHLLTPLPEPGHFLFVIDNSAAERFVCPTLAANYLVEGREPHPTNAALIFGGALHVGIETLLRGNTVSEVGDDVSSQTELLIRAAEDITSFFTKHPAPLDEYRTLTNALEVLRFYQQRMTFPDYNMRILSDEKGPLIERAFELPLGVLEIGAWVKVPHLSNEVIEQNCIDFRNECPPLDKEHVFIEKVHVAWAGRVDVIAFCNGTARIVDHKTTSIGGEQFVQDFQLSSQTRGYLWAAQQLWPELNVTGFCLDAIYLKRPAKGCSIMERGPRGGEPALQFFRSYFDYTPQSVADWADNALVRVEDFIHSLVRGYFPMEVTYCFNRKYGKCPYHDVCLLQVDNPEGAKRLLHSEAFRPVTWNPTNDR